MKQLSALCIAAFLLSQPPVSAQVPLYTPVPWPFDQIDPKNPDAVKLPTDTQKKCAALSIGTEKCNVSDRVLSLLGGNSGVITFHNDSIAMIDNSEELQLRQMLLSSTTSSPHFQQHTHGKEHALFVANQTHGTPTLNRYKCLGGRP